MIYPDNITQKILFDKIKQQLTTKCLSEIGKENIQNISWLSNKEKIEDLLTEVDEFKNILLKYDNFPTDNYFDARNILAKAEIIGSYLDTEEIYLLKKSLQTIKSIISFLQSKNEIAPNLAKKSKAVLFTTYVSDRINLVITSNGRIKDNASKELKEIRYKLHNKRNSVSRIVNKILSDIKSNGWIDTDLSVTYVNNRLVVPILSAYKRKIKGLVHDVSATGKTSYIEPEEIVLVNNEIVELENLEKNEIRKILTAFTNDIRPYISDLEQLYHFLGQIDFIRAKALFAIETNSIKPGISENQEINLFNARHPLLEQKLKKEKRKLVPLSIKIDEKNRIILISGPNAGGKSVSLKTVALIQYMFQSGLLVPVGGASELGVFDNIFIDIGDEQSVENDLSTYSSHLQNMKFMLKNANEKTLVFIDEFGTGTEPGIGGVIAESILDALNNKKPRGVITTHYSNLKHFAAFTPGIINAAMLFDTAKIEPVFKLSVGKPGSSFAFETARKIGLPEDVLQKAEKLRGKEQVNFDKHLRQLLRDKKYWEDKREKIKNTDKILEEKLKYYEKELKNIKQLKQEIINKAKQDAENIVKSANKIIEKTVHDIKKAQAEKEKTKKIRQEFTEQKQKLFSNTEKQDITDKKIEKINRQKRHSKQKNDKVEFVNIDTDEIRVGDKVQMRTSNTVGEVIELNKKNAIVAFGNMITSVKLTSLKKISNKEYKRSAKQSSSGNISGLTLNKKANFNPNIDVRGMRVDEALQKVTQFIDEAVMFGFNEVKILHGTGTGALRVAIRDYLKTFPFVKSAKDEHIEFGGAGITVVKIDL